MSLTVSLVPIDATDNGDLALFDMIEAGVMLRVRFDSPHARMELIAGLTAAGMIRGAQRPAGPLRLLIAVPIRNDATAQAKVVLHVSEIVGGLIITSASSVRMNLQQALRARHRIAPTLVGLGGDRNFSKPTAECDQSDLEVQLEAIGRCIDALRHAVVASLPGCDVSETRLQIRKGEICHDLSCSNAEDIARATARAPAAGSRFASQTEYPLTFGGGRSPTWHFSTHKRGPVRKGYAKLARLLRTELSCLHHDAVVQCVGQRSEADVSFDGAVALALEFYHAAGELCCEVLDHVRTVSVGARTMHDLLAELENLRAIAQRQRTAGGYTPSLEAAQEAQRVLNSLLGEGIVHARGLRKGTKVRDELERLVACDGPLVRGASPGVYCLSPNYGLALTGGNDGPTRKAGERNQSN